MTKYRESAPLGDVFPYAFTSFELDSDLDDFENRVAMVEEAKAWCKDQFGPTRQDNGDRPRYKVTATRAKFRDPTDATAFKLRWC